MDQYATGRLTGGTQVIQDLGPWRVVLAWPRDVDQGGPWEIRVLPRPGATVEDVAGGLGSTALRRIDFQAAAAEWRAKSEWRTQDIAKIKKQLADALRSAAADGVTDQYLARLASMYVSLVNEGEPGVTAKLAEMTGKQPETIRAHLKQARTRQLLTSIKGRAGGHLTPLAMELLGYKPVSGEFTMGS